MKKLLLLLLISSVAFAGLPPTTSKDSSDTSNVTTFNYQFPNFTGTHTGTNFSLGVNSIAGGGTGTATTSQNYVFAGPTSGSGAQSFRALVAGDIPSLSSVYLPLAGGTLTGALSGTTLATSSNITDAGTLSVTGTSTFTGNVGIGTTSPSYPLTVSGSGEVASFGTTGLTNQYINVRSGGSGGTYFGLDASHNAGTSAGVLAIQAGANKGIAFITNNDTFSSTPDVVIDLNGNLGIGTTIPTAGLTVATAGAASTPAMNLTGAPYTGGTATATYPLFYLNDGTAPSTWSTSGTEFGINAPSGFAGNFIDFHNNGGGSLFEVNSTGALQAGAIGSGYYLASTGFQTNYNGGNTSFAMNSYTNTSSGAYISIAGTGATNILSLQTGSATLLSLSGKTSTFSNTLVLPTASGGVTEAVITSLATPVNSAFTTATTGGSLTGNTMYYYRVVATDAIGTSLASTETSKLTGTGTNTNTITVNWAAIPGATGYSIYGRTTGAELLIASVTGGQTITYTDLGSISPSGALPAANNTGNVTASGNVTGNTMIAGYATTATAAGTTTLTVSSAQQQFFTGTTTQTVVLPVTSTLVLGQSYTIMNNSTGLVTVQSSGANNVMILAANTSAVFTVILTSGTTAASWSATLYGAGGAVTPTVQKFLSGSGTYTTPANVTYITVQMVGGGGGGSGSGTSGTPGAGGTGGNTTFGTSLLVTNGGAGTASPGGASTGGAGGTASLGSGPIGIALTGGIGQGFNYDAASSTQLAGGSGAATPFGGQGAGTTNIAGLAASVNTGAGGGGSGSNGTAAVLSGAGGGAGGYVNAIITSPSANYAYSVGTAGTAGTAGTSGFAGGAGGSGVIIVTEYYANGAVGTATNVTGTVAIANGGTGATTSAGALTNLGTVASSAIGSFLNFSTGALTAISAGEIVGAGYTTHAITTQNLVAVAATFTCATNPTFTLEDCGSSATCTSPTTIGSATVTAANTIALTTVSGTIASGHYWAWEITAGTCTILDANGSAGL